MKWEDVGVVLSVSLFSENQARLTILTSENGRQSGLVRLTQRQAKLQIGDLVHARWNARLAEHLGTFQIERLDSPSPRMFADGWRLMLLQNMCGMASFVPDKHPYKAIYEHALHFIEILTTEPDVDCFMRMTVAEKMFLAELGFGIDLDACCVTHTTHDLTHISPKTGRAVSRDAAEPYKEKLLPLPRFWMKDCVMDSKWVEKRNRIEKQSKEVSTNFLGDLNTDVDTGKALWSDIRSAFNVTTYFWKKWLLDEKQSLPTIRNNILAYCDKQMRTEF